MPVGRARILGVPWQDIRSETGPDGAAYPPMSLHFQTAAQLVGNSTWKELLESKGPAGVIAPPTDALMLESTTPRVGLDGETPPEPLAPPGAGYETNPVNGHEWRNPGNTDPQYACIFRLPDTATRDCTAVASGPAPRSACDCTNVVPSDANPLCQDSSGAYTTTQRFAKAYPSLRELSVMRDLGVNSVPASLCARNLADVTGQDYGYRPAFDPVVNRLKETLTGTCLPNAIRPLPDPNDPSKTVAPCTVTEARPNPDGSIRCDPNRGRTDLPPGAVAMALAQLRSQGVCDGDSQAPCSTYTLCEIQEADASCHTDQYPDSSTTGWCFVDPDDVSTDSSSIVEKCPADARRVVRFVDPQWDTPANGATALVTCTTSK